MTKGQETVQRLLAVVVIMAMLGVMGIPLTVIVFFATVVYFVWRAVQRSEQQDIKNIFDFYIAANEILRDDEKRWYGFEIHQVVGEGERVMHLMPDPPPLVYFALGVEVAAGPFPEAIRIRDTNPLDHSVGVKVFALGVGLVIDGPAELTSHSPGTAAAN